MVLKDFLFLLFYGQIQERNPDDATAQGNKSQIP